MTASTAAGRAHGVQTASEFDIDESDVRDGEILVRGVPIGSLIGSVGLVDMVFVQLQARLPSRVERQMLEAYLVSLCEHGLTSPSTHGPRAAGSVRAPFAASAISFITAAMGPYHFGALELAMRDLLAIDASGDTSDEFVEGRLDADERVWGYGHRVHRCATASGLESGGPEASDPRVRKLCALADDLGWDGRHLCRVREVGRLLHERKRIPINIDGLGAGLLLDMGFAPESALLFVILGRLANIARLHGEEQRAAPNRFTGLTVRPGSSRPASGTC